VNLLNHITACRRFDLKGHDADREEPRAMGAVNRDIACLTMSSDSAGQRASPTGAGAMRR
jgi:hypothetical protein